MPKGRRRIFFRFLFSNEAPRSLWCKVEVPVGATSALHIFPIGIAAGVSRRQPVPITWYKQQGCRDQTFDVTHENKCKDSILNLLFADHFVNCSLRRAFVFGSYMAFRCGPSNCLAAAGFAGTRRLGGNLGGCTSYVRGTVDDMQADNEGADVWAGC